MNPTLVVKPKAEVSPRKRPAVEGKTTSRPSVLIASVSSEVYEDLKSLLDGFSLNVIWLKSVSAAKNVFAKEKVIACLSGFWLQDGTYRELVRHIRRENKDVPVILVAEPACTDEYREYLAAMNIGALDFLSHPYKQGDIEQMLGLSALRRPQVSQQEAFAGPDLHPRAA